MYHVINHLCFVLSSRQHSFGEDEEEMGDGHVSGEFGDASGDEDDGPEEMDDGGDDLHGEVRKNCPLVQVFLKVTEVDSIFPRVSPDACVYVCVLYLIIVLLHSLSSHQNPPGVDGGGSAEAESGGYVPSEGSEDGDDDTDGDTDSYESSNAEEGPLRCEKCEEGFDTDSLWECDLCIELYCRDCLGHEPLGEEVR